MIANFYIIPESLSSENLSQEDFRSSLTAFISEYHLLNEYKEDNKIFIQQDVYDVLMPNGESLGNFVFSQNQTSGEERSLKTFLSSILSKLPQKDISLDQLKQEIKSNSLENCVGIISFVKIADLANENQIIYDSNSWLDFRRYHLGLYHGDNNYFIAECIKYYPKLFFHEENSSSVNQILMDFSQKIIFHLNALNDILPDLLADQDLNHTDLLRKFSVIASLDETATLEGANKTRLKFSFKNDEGLIENIVCEPHIKLCYNNSNDGSYYHNRIYFYFGKPNIQNSKILIAHIGKHL